MLGSSQVNLQQGFIGGIDIGVIYVFIFPKIMEENEIWEITVGKPFHIKGRRQVKKIKLVTFVGAVCALKKSNKTGPVTF